MSEKELFKVKSVEVLQVTTNYDLFKPLLGNRVVEPGRIQKIMRSVDNVGWVPNPILVNENYEVIDGQGRLEVARQRNLPVCYVQIRGLDVRHCISMNVNQSNWKMSDYISSYADQGVEAYVLLKELIEAHPRIGYQTIIRSMSGNATYVNTDIIKAGNLKYNKSDFAKADKLCVWLERMLNAIDQINPSRYKEALTIVYLHTSADKEHVVNAVNSRSYKLEKVATNLQALDQLDKAYNYGLTRKNRVYIKNEYRVWLDSLQTAVANEAKIRKNSAV